MIVFALDRPLAEIVSAVPESARVLESFGLDYCCGGGRPFGDACADAGVDPDVVIEVLANLEPGPEPDWVSMGPAELVDHLESTHHAYLHAELGRLDALAEKVAGVHESRHPELIEALAVFKALRAELEPHLLKEERVLFPMIRELATSSEAPTFHCGSVRNPISVMMLEHDRAAELLATLRSATNQYQTPADGCASYRALYDGLVELEADTHLHVYKENNLLFPVVVALEAPRSNQQR
jgi:regulator of cell morphogenesis and NO signaling